jgi:tetratricopeptide (TPR) repeat protein/TolB-like protein
MSGAEADPLLGTRLGRYRIVAALGSGGMGVVYRAHDTELERDVALKMLPPEVLADAAARATLLREARTASQLNHPHICTIHEVGEAEGRWFIAMELVDGRPLRELIPPDGLPDETVARYGAPLARALAHAHAHGVIHRDLKAANVVVTADGRPKLLDFGLSHLRGAELTSVSPTHPGAPAFGLVGTPQYLAPELLVGGEAGVRSDLWSLGVVLHEMCSGRPPFAAEHVGGLVTAILHGAPEPLPVHTSPGLRAVVARCLAKDAAQRYASADEAAAALEALLPGTAPAAAGRVRKRSFVLPVAIASVVSLAAAFAYFRFGPGGAVLSIGEGAVLVWPMEVRGQVQGAEFAGRAFAEAVSLDLAQSSALHVMPVPSAGEMPAPGSAGRARAARELGAERYVTGAITRTGDSLRVSVSLVDAVRNQVLWGEEGVGRPDDLPLLASTLALRIADRLGAPPVARYDYFMYVTGPPEMATSPEMTEALGAVRRYEIGTALDATRRLVARFPRQRDARVLRVVAMFIDARYEPPDTPRARALAAQLDTLHALDPHNPWYDAVRALRVPPGDTRGLALLTEVLARPDLTPAARAAVLTSRADVFGHSLLDSTAALADAEQAIRLDPASDLALSTLARWLSNRGRDAEAAERVRQALALNPTVVNYWHQLGNCMLRQGKWKEYVADLEQAAKLSPQADALLSAQSDGLACVGRYAEAADCARRALALRAAGAYELQLALCQMRLGNWDEAAPLLERACREDAPAACTMVDAAQAVRLAASQRAAAQTAAVRAAAAPASKSGSYAMACYHARRGERAAALELLESFPARHWAEPALERDPNFGPLHGDPRFRRLAKSMREQPIARVFAEWTKSR